MVIYPVTENGDKPKYEAYCNNVVHDATAFTSQNLFFSDDSLIIGFTRANFTKLKTHFPGYLKRSCHNIHNAKLK